MATYHLLPTTFWIWALVAFPETQNKDGTLEGTSTVASWPGGESEVGNPLDIFLFVTLDSSSLVQFPSCPTQRNTGSRVATFAQQQDDKWTRETRASSWTSEPKLWMTSQWW